MHFVGFTHESPVVAVLRHYFTSGFGALFLPFVRPHCGPLAHERTEKIGRKRPANQLILFDLIDGLSPIRDEYPL